MERVITNRYAGKCRKCGNGIPAGARAIWLGKGRGIRHEHNCTDTPTNVPEPVKSEIPSVTVDFSEVRETFQRLSRDDYSGFSAGNRESLEWLKRTHWVDRPEWVGATIPEMLGWLDSGYTVEGLQGMESLIPAKPRRRLNFAEEGDELLFDLAWSGIDEHFAEWEKRIQKPALTILVDCAYSASNSFETIKPYFLWLARMVQTLDEMGIDIEVKVGNHTQRSNTAETESQTWVRVKSHGEATDVASWSAMFSPGCKRHLIFVAQALHSQKIGGTQNHSWGSPVTHPRYDVQLDKESQTIHVKQANGGSFPEFDMTQKLAAVLQELSS